jgi:hypothetical protein
VSIALPLSSSVSNDTSLNVMITILTASNLGYLPFMMDDACCGLQFDLRVLLDLLDLCDSCGFGNFDVLVPGIFFRLNDELVFLVLFI